MLALPAAQRDVALMLWKGLLGGSGLAINLYRASCGANSRTLKSMESRRGGTAGKPPRKNGKSPSTIKTDLAAIRFFLDKMSNPSTGFPPMTSWPWSWSGAASAERVLRENAATIKGKGGQVRYGRPF